MCLKKVPGFSQVLSLFYALYQLVFTGSSKTPGSDVIQNLNTSGSNTSPITTPNQTQQPNTVTLPDTNKK